MIWKITKIRFNIFLLLTALVLINTPDISAAPSMVCTRGSNLIVNGDAETDQGAVGNGSDADVSAWTSETGAFTIVKYGTHGDYPTNTDPGPANRGNFFFAGGNSPSSGGTQLINVSDCASQIDSGKQKFSLSGFFGGFGSQDDSARLNITFRNSANNALLGTASIGAVSAADRGGSVTGLLSRVTNGTVPIGTRFIEVVLQQTLFVGTANDGYADNLSLVLNSSTAATTSVSGRVMSGLNRGIAGIRLTLTDSQGDTRMTVSTAFGYYIFEGVEVGSTYILTATGKHFTFAQPSLVLSVNEETQETNFIAVPAKRLASKEND